MQDTWRRVLCLAQRYGGLPDDRLRRLGRIPQAAPERGRRCRAGRHPLRPPRARRRAAHPFLLRCVARGDQERRCACRRLRAARRQAGAMSTARERVLGRVRNALGRRGGDPQARARAEAYLVARAQGPRPTLPADLVTLFMQRARDMESTIERVASVGEIPARVARYLDALELPPELAAQKSHAGVCWPEFAKLDWAGAGLAITASARSPRGSHVISTLWNCRPSWRLKNRMPESVGPNSRNSIGRERALRSQRRRDPRAGRTLSRRSGIAARAGGSKIACRSLLARIRETRLGGSGPCDHSVGEIPARVARYLDALELPPELAAQKSHAGVCWPEFAKLDWAGAGLAITASARSPRGSHVISTLWNCRPSWRLKNRMPESVGPNSRNSIGRERALR